MAKKLSIAVVGETASGKTYLLYDLIHAFHLLGYEPRQLPLSYPHSSFGKFFFDTINADTGGILKTDVVASRPESHYGAHLVDEQGNRLEVDFLNIPGEVFSAPSKIQHFFELKKRIERNKQGVFWLAQYRSPAGHTLRLVVPNKDFVPSVGTAGSVPLYRSWGEIAHAISQGGYKRLSCKAISGRELLKQMHTIVTDTVLLTVKEKWNLLMGTDGSLDVSDFEENLVSCFYPLVYCQNATDLIVCDSLFRGNHTGGLSHAIKQYFSKLDNGHVAHVFLAYRDTDVLLKQQKGHLEVVASAGEQEVAQRNRIYARCVGEIMDSIAGKGSWLNEATRQHIRLSASRGSGNDFWHLLSQSLPERQRKALGESTHVMPPHVYFTATPIDAGLTVYDNDTDATRFVARQGSRLVSFIQQNCADMSHHFCFGSLQLLMDILARNNALSRQHQRQLPDTLRYFFEI